MTERPKLPLSASIEAELAALGEEPLTMEEQQDAAEQLDMVNLLRHVAQPPTLSPERRASIAEELFGKEAWDNAVSPAPTWRQRIQQWLTIRPIALTMAATACIALIVLQMPPSPNTHTPIFPKSLSAPTLAKSWSQSPWKQGANPFQTTRSPAERLDRVVGQLNEYNLDRTLEQQSHQVLLR